MLDKNVWSFIQDLRRQSEILYIKLLAFLVLRTSELQVWTAGALVLLTISVHVYWLKFYDCMNVEGAHLCCCKWGGVRKSIEYYFYWYFCFWDQFSCNVIIYSVVFIESSSTSPKKKHKRKHKKHKKKKDHGLEGYDEERKKEKSKDKGKLREKEKDKDVNKGGGRAVKLKIKLRGETVATTQWVYKSAL